MLHLLSSCGHENSSVHETMLCILGRCSHEKQPSCYSSNGQTFCVIHVVMHMHYNTHYNASLTVKSLHKCDCTAVTGKLCCANAQSICTFGMDIGMQQGCCHLCTRRGYMNLRVQHIFFQWGSQHERSKVFTHKLCWPMEEVLPVASS